MTVTTAATGVPPDRRFQIPLKALHWLFQSRLTRWALGTTLCEGYQRSMPPQPASSWARDQYEKVTEWIGRGPKGHNNDDMMHMDRANASLDHDPNNHQVHFGFVRFIIHALFKRFGFRLLIRFNKLEVLFRFVSPPSPKFLRFYI